MRESVLLELRLRRFGVWRGAVATVAGIALAALAAWTSAMLRSSDGREVALVAGAAALLALMTVGVACSLLRIEGGVLACGDGGWIYVTYSGAVRAGALEVAIDLGPFLLLRLGGVRRAVWLPVQRLGLERDWHALRCAIYSPPAAASSSVPRPNP